MTWQRVHNFHSTGVDKKYGFSDHLKEVGDWVETYPLSDKDLYRICKAAHAWAYRKDKTVKVTTVYTVEGKCSRITLMKHYRNNGFSYR